MPVSQTTIWVWWESGREANSTETSSMEKCQFFDAKFQWPFTCLYLVKITHKEGRAIWTKVLGARKILRKSKKIDKWSHAYIQTNMPAWTDRTKPAIRHCKHSDANHAPITSPPRQFYILLLHHLTLTPTGRHMHKSLQQTRLNFFFSQ